MIKSSIDEILENANPDQAAKIEFLKSCVIRKQSECQKKPSDVNLKMYRSAEKELEDYLEQIESDQDGKVTEKSSLTLSFDNLQKVLIYLKGQNWKISQATIYKHKNTGLIKPDGNGHYSLAGVEAYAANYLKRIDGSRPADDDDSKKKREAEIRKVVAQAEHWELKTKVESGLYVPKDMYEKNLATRAKVLKSDLLGFCRSSAPDIVTKINGDPELIPDLIQYLTNGILAFLNRYCENVE